MNHAVVTNTVRERWKEMLTAWHLKTRGLAYPPGRNDLPHALLDLYSEGAFCDDVDDNYALLEVAIEDAWTSAEFPSLAVDPIDWVDLFEAVGFLSDAEPTQLLQSIPTLFRAAVEGVTGLSWTDSREQAEWFHQRNIGWGLPAVLLERHDVLPGEVLAYFHDEDNGRAEHEWILDPSWVD